MASLGLPPGSMQRLEPMSPRSACQRMCANLVEIYSGRQDSMHIKVWEGVSGVGREDVGERGVQGCRG